RKQVLLCKLCEFCGFCVECRAEGPAAHGCGDMSMMITIRFFFVVLILLRPFPASAQFSSTIQGTVTDAQGGVLPGATVQVTNTTTGLARTVTTSEDGVYRVFSLGAGTYRIEVDLQGFRKSQRDVVSVGISETTRVDF